MYISESVKEILSDLCITSKQGDDPAPWEPHGNHFIVTVKSYRTNERILFDFWDSIHNQRTGEESSHLEMLQALSVDALTYVCIGDYPKDYVREFGISEQEANRVIKGCKSAYNKMISLGLDDGEIEALSRMDEEE